MKKTLNIIYYLLIIALVVVVFSGCTTARDKFVKYIKENPIELAEQCAINFPSKTEYIEGEVKRDTLYQIIEGEKIECPDHTFVKCPDQKVKTIIEKRTDTIVRENTANVYRLTALNSELSIKNKLLKSDYDSLKSENKWLYIILVVLGIGLLIVFKFK